MGNLPIIYKWLPFSERRKATCHKIDLLLTLKGDKDKSTLMITRINPGITRGEIIPLFDVNDFFMMTALNYIRIKIQTMIILMKSTVGVKRVWISVLDTV